MQFNADTATNYSRHFILGDGATASSGASTTTNILRIVNSATSASASNIFGTMVIDILDYTNTSKFKTVRSISGVDLNGTGSIEFRSGNWRSTNAITSIKIFNDSGNSLAQYSSFALYGIKAL
jgi:hypothetical protein